MGNTVTLYTLHRAIRDEDVEAVRTLLSQKVEINAKEDGVSPLHLAVKKGNEEILNLLLNSAADVNTKDDSKGFAPVHSVVKDFDGNIKMLEMLLYSGADINIRNNRGDSVLHLAVEKNNISLIEYLLSRGAEVNLKNECGETPLHITAQLNKNDSHLDTAEVLLNNPADIHALNTNNEMPLHYLLKCKKDQTMETSIYELFLNYSIKSINFIKKQQEEGIRLGKEKTEPDLIMNLLKTTKKPYEQITENQKRSCKETQSHEFEKVSEKAREKAKNREEEKNRFSIIVSVLVIYSLAVSMILLFSFAYSSVASTHQPPV